MNTSIDPYQLAPEMRCAACPAAAHHRCIGLDCRLYCRRAQEAAAGADNGYPALIARRSGEARVKLEIVTGPAVEAPPYPDRDRYLAPLRREPALPWQRRPWEGCARRKPWEYPVVAALAHLDQPDLLAAVVETLRGQTTRPFIHVIDTGSLAPARRRLEAMELECDDMQIDYLSPRGWAQTSTPVAVAMDLAFAACPPKVEYLYSTHVDVFLKRPDFLAYLAARCDAMTPVVGYQMSPRRGWRDDLWARVPSHTATMYHMPTMRAIRATWNMVHAAERLDLETERYFDAAFPDTETNLGLTLIRENIGMRWLEDDGSDPGRPGPGERRSWLCLGPEPNEPYDTPWLRHERSYTAHAVYAPDVAQERRARCERSIAESRERVRAWSIPAAIPIPAVPASAPLPDWPAAWRARPVDPDDARAAADCPHRQVQPGARPCTPAVCRPTGRRPGELVRLADCVACINDDT